MSSSFSDAASAFRLEILSGMHGAHSEYLSPAYAGGTSSIRLSNAITPIIDKQITTTPPALTEIQIRNLVRQEIQASGSISGLKPLLEMTPDQAVVISTAIALLWATAWCFKQVAKFLKEKDYEDS